MADIVNMPKLGFDMAEGTLVRWVIQEGEQVSKGAILAEIETDKATVEVESDFEGILFKHLVQTDVIVPINTPIAVIAKPGEEVDLDSLDGLQKLPSGESISPEHPKDNETTPTETETRQPIGDQDRRLPGGVKASPLARRMAKDLNIDLQKVDGTGQGGRIVKNDIQSYLEKPSRLESSVSVEKQEPLYYSEGRESERFKLNRLRAAIGKRMQEAKQQAPHFYITYEYDLAPLLDLRKKINAMINGEEKTSVNDFIIKAVALTLRSYPNLNATLDGVEVIRHGEINIGVAVAVEGGLLTVVNRETDRKPIRLIADEVRQMVKRARDGKVRPNDIEGSTFSVSNLGMYGVDEFIAIINPPEAAILAVGAARQIPVVEDGEIKPGVRMKATISVDHRVSDGAEAAEFMRALNNYLENPIKLLL